jgi:hypothetical protein
MRYWRRLSSNQRLLIVGGAAVIAVWLGWPSIKSTIGGIGHQLSRGLIAVARTLDPSGPSFRYDDGPGSRRRRQPRGKDDYREVPELDPLSRGEGDYAEPPGRSLRLPSGARLDRTINTDGSPHDRQGRAHRWRYCLDGRGHVQHCGRWHTGPAPEDE